MHHERSQSLQVLERFDEALADEERAVALAPEVAIHHGWLGVPSPPPAATPRVPSGS